MEVSQPASAGDRRNPTNRVIAGKSEKPLSMAVLKACKDLFLSPLAA